MSRFTVDTFNTGSIAAGVGTVFNRTIVTNQVNIGKIKVVPSGSTIGYNLAIYKKATALAADKQFSTIDNVTGNLFVPTTRNGSEVLEGWIIPYEDLDGAFQIHVKVTNLDTVSRSYDVSISYETASTVSNTAHGVRYADLFGGANSGARIANAANDLPSTGGTVDASGLEGAQDWNNDIFAGITKPITLILGAATHTLSVNLTIPSNVIAIFRAGSIISVNSGKTLTFKAALLGAHTQCFAGAGSVVIKSPYVGTIFPQWWGAIGGSHDDTAAFQSAVNAIPDSTGMDSSGYELAFPPPVDGSTFNISDTVHFGSFVLRGGAGAAANDVLGWAGSKRGVCINSMGSVLKWTGPDQPGTTHVTITDSLGSFDLITDAKPMFSVVSCHDFTVRDLRMDGDGKCFAPIHFEGNHNGHKLSSVNTWGFKLGMRHGTAWDPVAGAVYWGYANSPYLKANVYDAPSVGGWQGDTQEYTCCSLRGSLAGFSTESGQNLNIGMNTCLINEGEPAGVHYGIIMAGGRISATGLGIIAADIADVWMPLGTNGIDVNNFHSESGAPYQVKTSSIGTVPAVKIVNGDKVSINLAGAGGQVSLEDIADGKILRTDGAYRADISIKNSHIISFGVTNTSTRDMLNISMENCTLDAAITGLTQTNCYLKFQNVSPLSNLPPYAIEWSALNEHFHGNAHHGYGSKTGIAVSTNTKIGTIATGGSGNTGHCLLRLDYANFAPASNVLGCFGLYAFSWCTDSTPAISLSPVEVIKESKALDTIATFVPTVTLNISGANIEIFLSQVNAINDQIKVNVYAEIYSGGSIADVISPLWTAA